MSASINCNICVVGAGPSGAILAGKLAEAGLEVALVEQGERYDPSKRADIARQRNDLLIHGTELERVDFDTGSLARRKAGAVTSRGPYAYGYSHVLAVGGSTLHWHGHTPRPTEDDLQARTRFGYGRDWPISYRALEPWLLRAENELGVAANADNPYASFRSGPFPMPAHAYSYFEREFLGPTLTRLGWTPHSRPNAINSVARDGRPACMICRACTTCPSGARYAADLVHVPRFERFPNGTLYHGIKLRRLEADARGKVVAAHAIRLRDGAPIVFRAERFVLAMGGVETPRMLLLSGTGTAYGQIGRGFSDHALVGFSLSLRRTAVGRSLGFPAMYTEHFRRPEARAAHQTYHLSVMPSPVEDDWEPTAELTRRAIIDERLSLRSLRAMLHRSLVGWTIHEMEGRGHLDLDPEEVDAFGDPVARVAMQVSERDAAGLADVEPMLSRLAEALDADRFLIGGLLPRPIFASHPTGATAMGASPDTGACDTDLKVFGTTNLFVTGSSTFPHNGASNPTLTAVALCLRLAAHLTGSDPHACSAC